MHHAEMSARVPGWAIGELFDVLCSFESYPAHSEAVRRISVQRLDSGKVVSSWEVNFRRGVLRWTEEDTFDAPNFSIEFRQLEGDVDHFAGEWRVTEDEQGTTAHFAVDFDLGIPGLDHILDPIAEQALFENFQAILKGLVGQDIEEARLVSWATG